MAPVYLQQCERLCVEYSYVSARQGRLWAGWPDLMRALRAARPDAMERRKLLLAEKVRPVTRKIEVVQRLKPSGRPERDRVRHTVPIRTLHTRLAAVNMVFQIAVAQTYIWKS